MKSRIIVLINRLLQMTKNTSFQSEHKEIAHLIGDRNQLFFNSHYIVFFTNYFCKNDIEHLFLFLSIMVFGF